MLTAAVVVSVDSGGVCRVAAGLCQGGRSRRWPLSSQLPWASGSEHSGRSAGAPSAAWKPCAAPETSARAGPAAQGGGGGCPLPARLPGHMSAQVPPGPPSLPAAPVCPRATKSGRRGPEEEQAGQGRVHTPLASRGETCTHSGTTRPQIKRETALQCQLG